MTTDSIEEQMRVTACSVIKSECVKMRIRIANGTRKIYQTVRVPYMHQ